jgi:hypothetical protein
MKRIIWLFFLLLPSSMLFAETTRDAFSTTLASYKADINHYKLAQNKHPAHLIVFLDKDGEALSSILNPNRYEAALQSAQSSTANVQSMAQLMTSQLDLISTMYSDAFVKRWGTYDQEYLNILDMKFSALKISWWQLHRLPHAQNTSAADLARFQKLSNQTQLLTEELEHNIEKGRFAKSFKPQAMARLAMFKGMRQANKPQH